MTVLQERIIQSLDGMPDNKLQIVLDMIYGLSKIDDSKKYADAAIKPRIGVAEGQKFIADGYDFVELNEEIAQMFGVNDQ